MRVIPMPLWFIACLLVVAAAAGLPTAETTGTAMDWPAFLARQDLVRDRVPEVFDHGAFLGIGLLGTTLYREGDQVLFSARPQARATVEPVPRDASDDNPWGSRRRYSGPPALSTGRPAQASRIWS